MTTASWTSTLPELEDVSPAAMDPSRVEAAMRDGYAHGHAAGREDGFAAGYAAGEAAGQAALADDRRRLADALASLTSQVARLDEATAAARSEFEATVADTAIAVAAAVLDREVAVATDPGAEAIARAMATAPSGPSSATVRLHPADVERLGDTAALAPGVALSVVADAALTPGGCVLTVAQTSIDATIEGALARVRQVLS